MRAGLVCLERIDLEFINAAGLQADAVRGFQSLFLHDFPVRKFLLS
jgi:hypothetical protein